MKKQIKKPTAALSALLLAAALLLSACNGSGATTPIGTGTEAESAPATETDTAPDMLPDTMPETIADTIPETDAPTQPETEPITEPETEPETEAETAPETETDPAESGRDEPSFEYDADPDGRTLNDALLEILSMPGLTVDFAGNMKLIAKAFGMEFTTNIPFGSVTALSSKGYASISTMPLTAPASTVLADHILYISDADGKVMCDLKGTGMDIDMDTAAVLEQLRAQVAEQGWGKDTPMPALSGEIVRVPISESALWMAEFLRALVSVGSTDYPDYPVDAPDTSDPGTTEPDTGASDTAQTAESFLSILDLLAAAEDGEMTLSVDLSDLSAPVVTVGIRIPLSMNDLPPSVTESIGDDNGLISSIPADIELSLDLSFIGGEETANGYITVPESTDDYTVITPEELWDRLFPIPTEPDESQDPDAPDAPTESDESNESVG